MGFLAAAPDHVGAQDKPARQPKLHVLHMDRPIYPRIALVANVQGQVTVLVTVTNGLVTNTQVNEARPPLLERATTDNIKSWRFDPSVNVTFTTTFSYVLGGKLPADYCCKITKHLPYSVKIAAGGMPVNP
jgi:TonB family protein